MTSTTPDVVLGSKSLKFSIPPKTLALVVGSGLVVAVIAGFWLSRRDERSAAASQALFVAQKSLADEEQKYKDANTPKTPVDSKKAPAPAVEPDLAYRALNVGEVFKGGVTALQGVATDYSGTRAGTEAALHLADLYYRHGQWDQAVQWFVKAQGSASHSIDRAAAWAGQGYALENLGKRQEAVQAFERALQVGEESWKGELLLALGRNQAALKQWAQAKVTYEKIIKEVPGTEAATTAESLKARLNGAQP